MLSRLYQLQTENQQMQERITNLAAQREFLLATNSQLGSIISESQQHQQHTTNGLSEPSYMSIETADIMTTNLSTPPSSSSIPSTTTTMHATSNTTSLTVSDSQTSDNSVLAQAPSYPSIGSPSVFTMPLTNTTSTTVPLTSSEITRSAGFRSKELPVEKKKQKHIKHSKQSTKLQQQVKAAMPGSVSVLGVPSVFTTIKPSEGTLSHSSSVLIGNLVPLEPTSCSNDLMANPQVAIPPSHTGQLLPPFSEIAVELNGKTVMMPRDITAVTSAIGGPIPAMSPVVSGHNVVR